MYEAGVSPEWILQFIKIYFLFSKQGGLALTFNEFVFFIKRTYSSGFFSSDFSNFPLWDVMVSKSISLNSELLVKISL